VWFCELAPLADAIPVARAVAGALGVRRRHGLSTEQSIVEYLQAKRLLLVLDNCEHVLEAASSLVAAIVSGCRGVVVLATSREALGVPGEQLWPVPALSMDEATVLFGQRARATRPDFEPDPEAAHAVADICYRLDGLPLAIELAAARMRVMTATEMARRLDDVRLLSGARTAQPRHQSLTAAIEWSYRLLAAEEQALFVRLSVFSGGADLAGVHSVCAEPGLSEADTLDLLTALVDKSMVLATSASYGTRYRMLETLRAYGRERVTDLPGLARRHAEHFVDLAERAARGVQGPDERMWVERVLPDADNLRAAFLTALAGRDADLALRLVASLPEVFQIRVSYEAAGWAEQALELATGDHPLYVAALGAAARGAWNLGDFERARQLATRAGGRAPGRGNPRTGYPADVAADIALYEGDVGFALAHYRAEVTTARRGGEPVRLVWSLYYVATCYAVNRTPELGLPAAHECVQVADSTGNPTAVSMSRYALGLVLKKADPAAALVQFDEAARLAGSVRNAWWQGIALM
jgi:predicted ATPase